MTAPELLHDIRAWCREQGDPSFRESQLRYFKHTVNSHGLRNPQLREFARSLSQDKSLGLEQAWTTGAQLRNSDYLEEGLLFLFLLGRYRRQLSRDQYLEMASWFAQGIHNWAQADTLSLDILAYGIRRNLLTIQDFDAWVRSEHPFQRRCAAASWIKELKHLEDISPLLKLFRPLMKDKQREVQQGIGWFLKNAWKYFPAEVENYLAEWKDSCSRLIINYACEHMDPEARKTFRKN